MRESPYYPAVEDWLKKQCGCCSTGTNKGTRIARADVIGLRHIGGDLSADYELVAIEVKTDEPFFRSIGQAAAYSVFAHRCYLASYERGSKPFARAEIEMALSLGVGLLKIRSRRADGVQEYLSAPARPPRHRFVLQMLETLGFSECLMCRGPFEGTYRNNVKRADRDDKLLMLRRAVEQTRDGTPTGYLFWAEGAVGKKHAAGDDRRNTARRYVCPDCLENILGPILDAQDAGK
jgi:hypothetical protein